MINIGVCMGISCAKTSTREENERRGEERRGEERLYDVINANLLFGKIFLSNEEK